MNLTLTSRAPYGPPIEFVERKGAGHPDTICDRLAEELARQLALDYQKYTGAVRHFNVDKAILAAVVHAETIAPLANDTSFAAVSMPRSILESIVDAIGYDIAQRMIVETDVSEVTIRLLSSIGHSVTEPQAVHIETTAKPDPAQVLDIAEDCFADWAGVTDRLVDGQYELY